MGRYYLMDSLSDNRLSDDNDANAYLPLMGSSSDVFCDIPEDGMLSSEIPYIIGDLSLDEGQLQRPPKFEHDDSWDSSVGNEDSPPFHEDDLDKLSASFKNIEFSYPKQGDEHYEWEYPAANCAHVQSASKSASKVHKQTPAKKAKAARATAMASKLQKRPESCKTTSPRSNQNTYMKVLKEELSIAADCFMIPNFEPYKGKKTKLRDAPFHYKMGLPEIQMYVEVNTMRKKEGLPLRDLPSPKSRNTHLKKLIDDRVKKPTMEYFRREMEEQTKNNDNFVMTHEISHKMFEKCKELAIEDYFAKRDGTKPAA